MQTLLHPSFQWSTVERGGQSEERRRPLGLPTAGRKDSPVQPRHGVGSLLFLLGKGDGGAMLSSCCTHGGGLPTRNICPLLYAATVPLGLDFPTGEVVDMDGAGARCARTDREEALAVLGDRPAPAPRSADRIQLDLSVLVCSGRFAGVFRSTTACFRRPVRASPLASRPNAPTNAVWGHWCLKSRPVDFFKRNFRLGGT
jgi:hypothetical protein